MASPSWKSFHSNVRPIRSDDICASHSPHSQTWRWRRCSDARPLPYRTKPYQVLDYSTDLEHTPVIGKRARSRAPEAVRRFFTRASSRISRWFNPVGRPRCRGRLVNLGTGDRNGSTANRPILRRGADRVSNISSAPPPRVSEYDRRRRCGRGFEDSRKVPTVRPRLRGRRTVFTRDRRPSQLARILVRRDGDVSRGKEGGL